ncbi:MAG: glyoxalase [Eubacterium sp.]|nr:glyoxalase [Eubacterium sp.]
MSEYDNETLRVFLENQEQLFEESVADTEDEAEAFLEDSLAVVCSSLDDVRAYLEESGMDTYDMSDDELEESAEVFNISDGRYLVVLG